MAENYNPLLSPFDFPGLYNLSSDSFQPNQEIVTETRDNGALVHGYFPNNNYEHCLNPPDCMMDVRATGPVINSPDKFSIESSPGTSTSNPASATSISSVSPNAYEPALVGLEHVKLNEQRLQPPVKKFTNGEIYKPFKHKKGLGLGRGRPRKTMYQSEISGDKNAIKLCIKKSNLTAEQLSATRKKRRRRKKPKAESDTEASESELKRSRVSEDEDSRVEEYTGPNNWGEHIPETILFKIFQHYALQEGALPVLVRLSKVCKLWQRVATEPKLWVKVDLNYVKERARTDLRLHWLILNRLTCCQDLNLGEWKIRNIQTLLEALCETCTDLRGLNMSGWRGLTADNLRYITSECKKLERLDLSHINSSSAANSQFFTLLGQQMSDRLTHLILAHNKMSSFTQIITNIATYCPNLQLLDLSNVKTQAGYTLLNIEQLQMGCPKLRVLRITNSQIYFAPANITERVSSPGFPCLEELSLAGHEETKVAHPTSSRSADDDTIDRILKTSCKLRLLDIRGCIRLTNSGVVRIPAWDLEHIFLSGCQITRSDDSGLELIIQKWSHSLVEVDLAWSTATEPLDAAVLALAEKGRESRLKTLNLCGSSVNLEPVKAVLDNCHALNSINLQSCRALPRGIKRLYTDRAVEQLRKSLRDRPSSAEDDDKEQSPDHKHSAPD